MQEKGVKKGSGCYLTGAFVAIVVIIILLIFYERDAVPYEFEKALLWRGNFWDIFAISWPLFAMGFGLNLLKLTTSVNPPEVHNNSDKIPLQGLKVSLMAGIFEEIVFRWIFLYFEMGTFWIWNQILVSMTGEPILQNVSESQYMSLFVDWLVAGDAEFWLSGTAWTVGFAVILSNWKFQKGHLYQGWTGWLFSGIGGLFFFRIMFSHGLFGAMLVHFLFDMMTFIMLYIDVQIEKALGMSKAQAQGKFYQWY